MEITQHVPWIVAAEGEVEPEPTWKDWIFLESVYRYHPPQTNIETLTHKQNRMYLVSPQTSLPHQD